MNANVTANLLLYKGFISDPKRFLLMYTSDIDYQLVLNNNKL